MCISVSESLTVCRDGWSHCTVTHWFANTWFHGQCHASLVSVLKLTWSIFGFVGGTGFGLTCTHAGKLSTAGCKALAMPTTLWPFNLKSDKIIQTGHQYFRPPSFLVFSYQRPVTCSLLQPAVPAGQMVGCRFFGYSGFNTVSGLSALYLYNICHIDKLWTA